MGAVSLFTMSPRISFQACSRTCMPVAPTEDYIFDDQKPAALAILDRIHSQHAVPIAIYDQHAGTTHGFGCRPDLENAAVKRAWEKAAEETVGWFEEHL